MTHVRFYTYRLLHLIAFLLLLSWNTMAGPGDLFFVQHFDNRNGLSNSSINRLFSDSDNLLWVGTWDGLNMYDGTNFHVFNYRKDNDSKSIGSNVIQDITEDKRGNLWITTIGGISRYEKHTGRFYNYFYNQRQPAKVSEQEFAIAIDTAGDVFCFSLKQGLSYYDALSDSFNLISLNKVAAKIIKIGFDALNHLWMLDNTGRLYVYHIKNKRLQLLQTFPNEKSIINFFIFGRKVFFNTPENKLYLVNTASLSYEEVAQMPHSPGAMLFYKDHYLLAWMTKGYGVFDKNFKQSSFLQSEVRQMRDIKITSLEKGTEDILWFGTDGNGMLKIFPKTKSFETVTTSGSDMPYNQPVRAFCEEDGNLWVGTKGSGIIRMQNFWEEPGLTAGKQNFLAPEQLDNNAVYSLKKGNDGLIYIGTDGKGIGIYDLENKKLHKWASIQGHDKWPEFGSVYAVLQDADQSVWLGTSGYGLIHLKIDRNPLGKLSVCFLEKFTFNNSNSGPANDIIYSLAEGGGGRLWVGCRYGGLSLMDKKTKTFRNFKAFSYEGSLSNNDVLSLFRDSRSRIWIGTSYGLNMISDQDILLAEPVFKKLTTVNGLPNNTIHAIEEDGIGQIWISTNKGLARVNPENMGVSCYQQSDGLQSNEFCDGAVWKDRQDNLFFGGTYGFNNFSPEKIQRSDWLPDLFMSDVLFGGKEVAGFDFRVIDNVSENPLVYSVSRKDNFFELNVKALSYLNADKCEYAYRLEGYDKMWHYAGTSGRIMYSNILPGNYLLKIKWSNGDGSWTKEIPLLQATVQQYFWLRPFALVAYAVLALSMIYFFYRYRKNKLEIKHQLEVEHLMRTKEEEIHNNRLGFFTNIAHELQTPLTLIMGSVERISDRDVTGEPGNAERSYFFSSIHQQASRLTYLVQQLLEFRRVEAGFFKNQYHYADISELFHNLAAPFLALSEQQGVRYELEIARGMKGSIDKNKVEKIVFNLLSNAFKYSGKDEQVIFQARQNLTDRELEIIVSNSGIALSQEQIDKLFEHFYVSAANDSGPDKFGTGIGLAFTKQLVKMLNGRINATCESKWVIFHVFLPSPDDGNNPGHETHQISDQPSDLYRAITSGYEMNPAVSASDHNKDAILEDLLDQDRKKILVVEDDQEIRFLLRDILQSEYIVYEAEDGMEALALISKMVPDCIICDVMMPNMSGLDLCNEVKNDVANCHIPLIMLSARGSEAHHTEGYEVGADAYISKPFSTAYLKMRVRKLIEYHEKLHKIFRENSSTDLLDDTEMPEGEKQFLIRMVQVIEDNIDEPSLNADYLEKEFCLSKMQLYRKMKTLTGMTPGEFIKNLRLKATARLLATTQLNVTEIFYRSGFNNQSYFFREFKKKYHCSPNEYRHQKSVKE